ncbi:MAG: ABC transporter permease [Gemmatimonadota bacterium]
MTGKPAAAAPLAWRERPIVQLTLARFREFYREPEAMFWTFVFPLLMAGGLGIAFRSKPPEVFTIGVSRSAPAADKLMEAFARNTQIAAHLADDTTGNRELRTGKIALLIGTAADGRLAYRLDDTRPEALSARRLADDAIQRAAGRQDPVTVGDELVRERGSRYIDFLIPGLLGMNMMGSSIWGLGFSVVDQRRKKLLKRFISTPMSRVDYLASFLFSRLSLLVLEVIVMIGFGALAFGVPLRGSWLALGTICLLGALGFGGLGLLIAARPKTVEGASGLMNLVMLPMWVFSGVFFSSTNFPAAMQPFIKALPLTAVNNALRANMLEGAGFAQIWPELTVIATWLVVCFALALRLFRWK